jgi:UDP-N-acetylglucosamine 2-epimerase (non-hydrolysing)
VGSKETAHHPRVMLVAGTRPECLKTASLVRALRRNSSIATYLINSGQHRSLVDQTFQHLGLTADIALPSPAAGRSLSQTVSTLRQSLARCYEELQPAIVVVQGDTSTAYAGALAARDLRIPLAHVEAGLRTANPMRPFPEEAFRRRIAPIARWHFAPTSGAASNLLNEGIERTRVHVVGNTVIDELRLALRLALDRPSTESANTPAIASRTITLTLHRRENYGRGLDLVCGAVLEAIASHTDLDVVCPVHPNPTVGLRIRRLLGGHPRVRLTDPMPYRSFVKLLKRSALVVTDSGGIQEEAPYLGVPVLVARDETERPEALASGTTRLVPLDKQVIVDAIRAALEQPRPAPLPFTAESPFGDGQSALRIADILARALETMPIAPLIVLV